MIKGGEVDRDRVVLIRSVRTEESPTAFPPYPLLLNPPNHCTDLPSPPFPSFFSNKPLNSPLAWFKDPIIMTPPDPVLPPPSFLITLFTLPFEEAAS